MGPVTHNTKEGEVLFCFVLFLPAHYTDKDYYMAKFKLNRERLSRWAWTVWQAHVTPPPFPVTLQGPLGSADKNLYQRSLASQITTNLAALIKRSVPWIECKIFVKKVHFECL